MKKKQNLKKEEERLHKNNKDTQHGAQIVIKEVTIEKSVSSQKLEQNRGGAISKNE